MHRTHQLRLWTGLALLALGLNLPVRAQDTPVIGTKLQGFQEVPAISTAAQGTFRARVDSASLTFELTYSGLEGGNVTQAHIHFGQPGVSGGITIWLCSNLPNPPLNTPACPQSGTVTGVRLASDVVGPAGQGISAGEFAEVLKAIRAGVTYANVHSTTFAGGEIRGQIKVLSVDELRGHRGDNDDHGEDENED